MNNTVSKSGLLAFTEQKIERQSDWLMEQVVPAFTPILFSRLARKNHPAEKSIETHPWMAFGTGTYVQLNGICWLLTANHVIQGLHERYGTPALKILDGQNIVDLHPGRDDISWLRNSEIDIAAIPMNSDYQPELRHVRFIDLDTETDEDPYASFRIHVSGYLRKNHR